MTFRFRNIWALVFAVLAAALLAVPASAKEIVIPALSGRVVDQAAILSTSQESDLIRKLSELERKTTAQLVVVTLKSLQGRTVEDWGLALGRGWKIGQAGKNNGVILVVAPTERELRIEVGYGLEGVVTDAEASAIVRNVIVPRFKAGNMYGGISDGVDAIGRALAGEAVAQPASSAARGSADFQLFVPILFFLFFVFISSIMASYRRSRRKGPWSGDDYESGTGWYIGGSSGSWHSGGSWSGGSSGGGGGFSGGGGGFGGGGSSGKW